MSVVAHFNRIDSRQDYVYLLNPDVLWVEPQREASIATELALLEGVPWMNPEHPDERAVLNLTHQLHSLSRINQLLEMSGLQSADVFGILRADLQYLDDLDVTNIERQITSGEYDVITPQWEQWGGGLNDRFCFIGAKALHPILMRRNMMGFFVERYGAMHAEKLLAMTVAHAGLRSGFITMRGERVRANGRVRYENFSPKRTPL